MKHWLVAALICFGSSAARAQFGPRAQPRAPDPRFYLAQAPADAPPPPPAAPDTGIDPQASKNLNYIFAYPLPGLGVAFGANKSWLLGLDTTDVAGPCIQREITQGQWLVGPCRDLGLLTHEGSRVAKIGFGVLYNAEHGNATYEALMGFDVPATGRELLNLAGAHVPTLQAWGAPKWVIWVNHVTSIYWMVGLSPKHDQSVHGNFRQGPGFQLSIPLPAAFAIQALGT